MKQAVQDLIEHIRGATNALNSDLETGFHSGNNIAHVKFSKDFPELSTWLSELSVLADQLEHQIALNGHETEKEGQWAEEAANDIIVENTSFWPGDDFRNAIASRIRSYEANRNKRFTFPPDY